MTLLGSKLMLVVDIYLAITSRAHLAVAHLLTQPTMGAAIANFTHCHALLYELMNCF
jgi:hypothetical protein